ncbi:hypothetical protein PR08_gp09 [Idiomarinaceae phage Phi1M2-2]|uniref:hypothetical protein n=1 Tax=Idiomarinaceae phage Phi1M2-2 TaxID=1527515 RepID=UPI0004F79EB6|nr:hypothetical protein PR08_gp09 [Idiomarinaceae phage Phi1M2-2]AIM40767.1 hypothetical protein M22_009 [Idiomarinaceae phage Phi1M2-2]
MSGSKRDDLVKGKAFGKRRLAVVDGSVCFDAGRQFRISHEFTSTPFVIRFRATQWFSLRKQSLTVDEGGVRFRAYRMDEGTAGGNFDTPIRIVQSNVRVGELPTGIIEIARGGTFTPNESAIPTETIRVRAAGATAQRTTVGATKTDRRDLPEGDYYLVFDTLGTSASGVYDLEFSLLD